MSGIQEPSHTHVVRWWAECDGCGSLLSTRAQNKEGVEVVVRIECEECGTIEPAEKRTRLCSGRPDNV